MVIDDTFVVPLGKNVPMNNALYFHLWVSYNVCKRKDTQKKERRVFYSQPNAIKAMRRQFNSSQIKSIQAKTEVNRTVSHHFIVLRKLRTFCYYWLEYCFAVLCVCVCFSTSAAETV